MKLTAGQLQMTYDQGFLRYIHLGEVEVLRMIYFALRDHNWDTIRGAITDEILEINEQSFSIHYRWISGSPRFPFEWQVSILGTEESVIQFNIQGKALADVRKNRTGFCILHSIKENAGFPCTIVHPDGSKTDGMFPRYISPHQPFFEIRKMQWPLASNGHAQLSFEGDLFEMEDQRNWSDDSFKTYCTPLAIPFPVTLIDGQEIRQSVRLELLWLGQPIIHEPDSSIILSPSRPLSTKPLLGVGAPNEKVHLTSDELTLIKQMEWDHYRIEVDFTNNNWTNLWDSQVRQAIQLGTDLEVWVFFSKEAALEASWLADQLTHLPLEMKVYLLILTKEAKSTPDFLLSLVSPILIDSFSNLKLGAGTAAYFTELNRSRPDVRELDFVSWSVNPQVHAFDDASLSENAVAIAYTVESARHYFPGKETSVSQISLKPRFNPNATAPHTNDSQVLPDSVDVRQLSLFGACWTLSAMRSVAVSESNRATFFEAVGWRGVFQGDQSPLNERLFPAKPGMLFPLYHVLKLFCHHKADTWIPLTSSWPFKVQGFGFQNGLSSWWIIGNLTNTVCSVQVKWSCSRHKIFVFDEDNLADSYFDPQFLAGGLEKAAWTEGDLKTLILEAHAILYAQLLD